MVKIVKKVIPPKTVPKRYTGHLPREMRSKTPFQKIEPPKIDPLANLTASVFKRNTLLISLRDDILSGRPDLVARINTVLADKA